MKALITRVVRTSFAFAAVTALFAALLIYSDDIIIWRHLSTHRDQVLLENGQLICKQPGMHKWFRVADDAVVLRQPPVDADPAWIEAWKISRPFPGEVLVHATHGRFFVQDPVSYKLYKHWFNSKKDMAAEVDRLERRWASEEGSREGDLCLIFVYTVDEVTEYKADAHVDRLAGIDVP